MSNTRFDFCDVCGKAKRVFYTDEITTSHVPLVFQTTDGAVPHILPQPLTHVTAEPIAFCTCKTRVDNGRMHVYSCSQCGGVKFPYWLGDRPLSAQEQKQVMIEMEEAKSGFVLCSCLEPAVSTPVEKAAEHKVSSYYIRDDWTERTARFLVDDQAVPDRAVYIDVLNRRDEAEGEYVPMKLSQLYAFFDWLQQHWPDPREKAVSARWAGGGFHRRVQQVYGSDNHQEQEEGAMPPLLKLDTETGTIKRATCGTCGTQEDVRRISQHGEGPDWLICGECIEKIDLSLADNALTKLRREDALSPSHWRNKIPRKEWGADPYFFAQRTTKPGSQETPTSATCFACGATEQIRPVEGLPNLSVCETCHVKHEQALLDAHIERLRHEQAQGEPVIHFHIHPGALEGLGKATIQEIVKAANREITKAAQRSLGISTQTAEEQNP